MIVGSYNDGLENYIEHYANVQVKKGRKVYIVEENADEHWAIKNAKNIKESIMKTFNGDKSDIDWIIYAKNGSALSV